MVNFLGQLEGFAYAASVLERESLLFLAKTDKWKEFRSYILEEAVRQVDNALPSGVSEVEKLKTLELAQKFLIEVMDIVERRQETSGQRAY